MHWIAKALAFKALDFVPRGGEAHHLLQKHFTRSLTVSDGLVRPRIEIALEYLKLLEQKFGLNDLSSHTHIDFGSGWIPIIPLVLYANKVEKQIWYDVRRNLRGPLVAQAVNHVQELLDSEGALPPSHRRPIPPFKADEPLETYLPRIGVQYITPYTFSMLENKSGPVLVTSSHVLNYVPEANVFEIFRRLREHMTPDSAFIGMLHLSDPFYDSDRSISPYNKYRFSEWFWNHAINTRLNFVNQMLARDYRRALEKAGFEIVHFETEPGSPEQVEALRSMHLSTRFRGIPVEELTATHLFFAARPMLPN